MRQVKRIGASVMFCCTVSCSDPASSEATKPHPDAALADGGVDAPTKDGTAGAPGTDAPGTDASGTDAPGADAPGTDSGSPAPGGPPLSWDDPRFDNVVELGSQSIPAGGSLVDASIVEFSGDASIYCAASCTLTRVRVDSRESLRISKGTIELEDSYLEATGQGDDHADVIQAYLPNNGGQLILRRTTIVAHETAATAGIFIADAWRPDLVQLEDVAIWGGPYGIRLHADGYDNAHLRMKNVCFVGPFGAGPMIIDGGVGGNNSTGWFIDEWTNVNECTIESGKLVIGAPIPKPD